ncbi:MAG TPA: AMP-dependent synthetase [Prolixibacteraceae bacterium]|nr:AMP-dependent synthetase [Prolixibacteraceae bacterium]
MGRLEFLTIPAMLQASFKDYAKNQSLVFVGEENRSYAQLEIEVKKAALQLQSIGVKKGDKVAILSMNMPQWGIAFFAASVIGAVVVPILPDFHPNEIKNILTHAEVSVVYVSETLFSKLDTSADLTVIRIENFGVVSKTAFPVYEEIDASQFVYEKIEEQDLASIIYTSGTTGKSKGVMLTHKNIVWTAQQCWQIQNIVPTDRFLSVLPLSHTLENTLVLILPLKYGASVHYLQKPPVASVLLAALKVVRPTIMLIVPLIVEKIYKTKILPQINSKFITRILFKIPTFRKILHKVAGKKLYETFGGQLKFFGIGGAKLDDNVERFLMEAGFPLAIGYGMTESSPLLAGAGVGKTKFLSTGPAMPGVQLRIANADKVTGQGEIQAKGENVMLGYYKEPDITKETITEDGWLRTGDLGYFDQSGNLYIKGRIKNMIVGSSGENIYPEEIESVINRMEYVLESLVVQQKGKLVALVHLNMEELENKYQHAKSEAISFVNEKAEEILKEIQGKVNEELNKFSQIQRVVLQRNPFEKTPTQKIKRFLYYA